MHSLIADTKRSVRPTDNAQSCRNRYNSGRRCLHRLLLGNRSWILRSLRANADPYLYRTRLHAPELRSALDALRAEADLTPRALRNARAARPEYGLDS